MSENSLTIDERRCLQMWFRQAIVQLEQQDAHSRISKWHAAGEKSCPGHHAPVGARRSRRKNHAPHSRELV